MAFSLATSLCRLKKFDAADVATAYVEWSHSSPPDIGMATTAALSVGMFFFCLVNLRKTHCK